MIPNEFVILPTETFISDNNYIISHITTKQFKKEEWKNDLSSLSTDNSSNLEGSYYSIEDVSDFELDLYLLFYNVSMSLVVYKLVSQLR